MIKKGDIIGYKKESSFKSIVLEYILKFISEKIDFQLIKLPNIKTNKIAVDSSIDSESEEIIKTLIKGNASDLRKFLPVYGNFIKPLYLFLDEEVLLYAKLKNLKFKKKREKQNKINAFTIEFEKKHPEVKRAVVNSILELYRK